MVLKLTVKPGKKQELIEFLEWDAAVARDKEPGTLRFDAYDSDEEGVLYVYEAYRDTEAFELHRQNEPFKKFGDVRKECIEMLEVLVKGTAPKASNISAD